MSQMVHSWISTQLENLFVHVIGGDWGKPEDFSEDGFETVACIRGSEFRNWKNELGATAVIRKIKSKSLETRKLAEGDLLVEISGGGPDQPVGRTVLITGQVLKQLSHPAVCTNFLRLARPSDHFNSAFLNYYLKKFYSSGEVVNYQGGSNNLRNLKFKEYVKIDTPVPPLAEQKVIADKLDTLLAQVETTKARLERIPQILKTFRQSVLNAAVSGKLTEEWRKSCITKDSATCLLTRVSCQRERTLQFEVDAGNTESKRLKTKIGKHAPKLPNEELPENWAWTSFMQSLEKVVDCHNKTAPYIDSGIPLIRTPDIRNGVISLSGAKYISQETYEYWSRRCPPKSGDIIFTREAPMGEAGIVPEGVTLCMGQRMMLLRPIPEYISPKYILLNILSLRFQERMKKSAIGTAVKHLRVADVEGLSYPLAPRQEQTEIVRRVEGLFAFANSIEEKANAALARVNNLTQSILAKAFRGELTEQWRKDNPELITGENSAEALLAKIKAEREALASKKKPKKKTKRVVRKSTKSKG